MSDDTAMDELLAGLVPGPTERWTVGDVSVTRVGEWVVPTPPDMLLPDLRADMITEHADWIGPYFAGELLLLSFHTFVIESAGRTIVVDTCLGDDPVRVVPGNPDFLDRLACEIDGGLDGVDVVLCTHLHFDHVGWNTRVLDGARVPTFPNARYLFSRADVDDLERDDSHDVAAFDVQPVIDAGLADLIDTHHAITPDVRTIPTTGHTPGHVSVLIESLGSTALITGDAVHTPLQFRYPEIAATPFDWDSARSTETRRALVDAYADTGVLVLGTHFAPPTAGHIRRRADGVWFDSAG